MPPPNEPAVGLGAASGTSSRSGRGPSTTSPTPTTTLSAKLSWDGLKGMASSWKEVATATREVLANLGGIISLARTGGSVLNNLGKTGTGIGGSTGSTQTSNHWLNNVPSVAARQSNGPVNGGLRPVSGPGGSMTPFVNNVNRGPGATGPAAAPSAAAQTTTAAPTVSSLGTPSARTAAAAVANAVGGGGGGTTGTGTPAPSGGTSMPWMSRLNVGLNMAMVATAGVANMASDRLHRNIVESIPLSAQATFAASMYGGNPNQIEMDRFRMLGQFAGSRQDVAQTAALSFRMGQTPTQAAQYMQGLGTATQAFGGTATTTQLAQANAGFLDPMVLRRQRSMGIQYARVGGQVRQPFDVAKDYIRNYEQRFNGGRKLNQFDFINLGTPGSGIRIRFQQLYMLDDETIDTWIVTAGLQQAQAGGNIDYNSSAALSAAGLNKNQLGLQALSTQTAGSRREASFAQQNQTGEVSNLRTEESIQNALAGVEDAASGLTNTFASLERVVKTLTAGLGLLGGVGLARSMLGGGGGGGGGGGLLGGLLRGGGSAAEGEVSAGAGGLSAGGSFALGTIGAVGVGMGIQQAVNAKDWGDIFQSTAMTTAGGAALGGAVGGPPGAVIGAAGGLAVGVAANIWGHFVGSDGFTEEEQRATQGAQIQAADMSDKQIINAYRHWYMTEGPGHGMKKNPDGTYQSGTGLARPQEPRLTDFNSLRVDPYKYPVISGYIDMYQRRRAQLIVAWMDAAKSRNPETFNKAAEFGGMQDEFTGTAHWLGEWQDVREKFNTFATTGGMIDDDDFHDAGDRLISVTKAVRAPTYYKRYEGGADERAIYDEFFPGLTNPMQIKPDYSEAATAVANLYSTPLNGQTGDPTDPAATATSTDTSGQYAFVNRMPMAPEPHDASWNGMHPIMKKRILAMIAGSKGKVHWEAGGGTRSTEQQRAMFLDRYRPGPGRGEVTWNGQKWHHVSGAAAAPPGRSMHEIGLAADMGGDMGWIVAHSKAYGLRSFFDVNDEPWHVQPAELPGSRSAYEKQGLDKVWGTSAASNGAATDTTATAGDSGSGGGGGGGGGGASISSGLGGSSAGLLSQGTSSLATLQGGAGFMGGGGGGGGDTSTVTDAAAPDTTSTYTGGKMTGDDVAKMAYEVGFRGQGLINVIGITNRESDWDPSAHNTNRGTGDNSYGLGQINMLGSLGPERARLFGITNYDDLLNPKTNLMAMYKLSGNGQNFGPWLSYRPGLELSQKRIQIATEIVKRLHLGDAAFDHGDDGRRGSVLSAREESEARRIIASAHLGDPISESGMGASSFGGAALPPGRTVGGFSRSMRSAVGGGVTVNVTIQSQGNYAYDAQRLAKAVRPAIEAEYAEVTAKRST